MSGTLPRQIRIITTRGRTGHNFEEGSTVTLRHSSNGSYFAKGYCVDRGHEDEQVIYSDDFEELKEKVVAKRTKVMYAVQDSDGDDFFFTRDRALAREVKAEEGGKANGIVIMQYGELKEIR